MLCALKTSVVNKSHLSFAFIQKQFNHEIHVDVNSGLLGSPFTQVVLSLGF